MNFDFESLIKFVQKYAIEILLFLVWGFSLTNKILSIFYSFILTIWFIILLETIKYDMERRGNIAKLAHPGREGKSGKMAKNQDKKA